MRYTVGFICGLLSISTAGAVVYDGDYVSGIIIEQDALIESDSSFTNANVTIKAGKTVTINDGVHFTNSGIRPLSIYGTALSYNLVLNGNNIVFQDANRAIVAGNPTWNYPGSNDIGNINITINGNNTLFDNNYSVHNSSTDYGQGGAIYIGKPNSPYYTGTYPTQLLTINGTGTTFTNNSAYYGGAIYNSAGSVIMNEQTTFANNSAHYGGAIYNNGQNYTHLIGVLQIAPNSVFDTNTATSDGGAIYNSNSRVDIGVDTLFQNNAATNNGGAIYNTGGTAVINIDTGTSSVVFQSASDSIYNNGGTINFIGTGTVSGALTSLTSVRGDAEPIINLGKASAVFNTVTLQDNTILKTTVWKDGTTVKVGNIAANTFNIQNSDELKLQIAVENRQVLDINGSELTILIDRTDAQATGWDFFGNPDKYPTFELENNLLYDIEFVQDGVYRITPKSNPNIDPSDTSDVMDNVAQAWNVSGFETGSVAESIANQLYVLSQFESTAAEYNSALELIKPIESEVIDKMIKRNMHGVINTISRRLYTKNYGFWTNAIYTHARDKSDDFTSNTFGGVFGYDIDMNLLRLGYSFGYMKTYAETGARKFDLDNNFNASIYSQFGIPIANSDLFINIIGNHSTYSITENKSVLGYNVDSDWDIAQTGIQGTIGLKYGLFGADIGMRDTITRYGSYMDSLGQHVDGLTDNALQFIANLNLAKSSNKTSFGLYTGIEVAAGSTDKRNIVTAPNNQRYFVSHTTNSSSVLTFGGDANMKLTPSLSLGVACDGALWGEYLEYSGKLLFNYAM